MKVIVASVFVLAVTGAAEAQITNCYPTGFGGMNCYTSQPYRGPGPLASFLNGFIEGRMARLRMERMQMENELLRRQLQR